MMNVATPWMRTVARWLIAREAAAGYPPEAKAQAAFRVCEKLRHYLSTFAGVAGFRSLLSRALILAKAEVSWLSAVEVKADGSLAELGSLATQHDRDEAEKGGVVLLAQLLGLLVTFIGVALTLRLVQDVWPDVPSDLMDPGKEKKQ
ncbi:MAG: hypothetical protein EHM27_08715 [Deltaproteobacteria bacterium]|nr:MAG: hypothetical protein EHM27_08715 [Deltaproteobacteria bacterium]